MTDDDLLKIPIDGVLDLHAFSPKDVKDLVLDYLRECRSQVIITCGSYMVKGPGRSKRSFTAF